MTKSESTTKRPRRRSLWITLTAIAVLLVPITFLLVPILTHQNQGISVQEDSGEEWPTTVTASGDDGRERVLAVGSAEDPATDSGVVDTSAIAEGDRFIVTGSGFDAGQGIYVAVCVIPDDPATKPGPCLGGVPDQEQQDVVAGTVQYAPSNWINDDWAWRLFGARGYDDLELGNFTAYLEMPNPVGEEVDCTVDACGIYTRNDHTALRDRVQDVFIPVRFVAAP
jgi:hypothetical protein